MSSSTPAGDQKEGVEGSGKGVKPSSVHYQCSIYYEITVSGYTVPFSYYIPRSLRLSICTNTYFHSHSFTSYSHSLIHRYVKYLYPYECEIENLSDPQELQIAIDSHKRDRRQSDTVEFMHQPLTAAGRNTHETLTPVSNAITATPGCATQLQILNSPVALPHGTIPPYSGSFIVTGPGGAQMVTPQISGPPQLVQMTTPHGIPVMIPSSLAGTKHELSQNAGDDRDDASSPASSDASDRDHAPPPAKRVALDMGHSIATTARIPPSGFVMTPSRHIVPTSHFAAASGAHVVMGPNSHIPIVMPTTTHTSFLSRTSPMETQVSNSIIVKEDNSRRSPKENGVCSPHFSSTSKRTQVISAAHLLHMTHPTHMPVVVPTTTTIKHNGDKHRTSESSSSEQVDAVETVPERFTEKHKHNHNGGSGSLPITSTTTSLKMPFANIAIQSGILAYMSTRLYKLVCRLCR